MTGVEWGRAPRGRTWHLLSHAYGLWPICGWGGGQDREVVEVSEPLPPRGGRPCPACVRIVDDLAGNVAAAKVGAESLRTLTEVDIVAVSLDPVDGDLEVIASASDSDGGVILR